MSGAFGDDENATHDPLIPRGAELSPSLRDSSGLKRSRTFVEWETKDKSRVASLGKLTKSTVFVFIFLIVEAVGGYLANSLAIMTDAAHLLSDVSSFVVSILAIRFARGKKTTRMTFGSGRIEILGAVISVIIIWVLTVWLVYEAVDRMITIFRNLPLEIDGRLMTIIAALGLLVNLVMMFILGGHSHEHDDGDHGHSHDIIGLFKQMMGWGGGHGHSHSGGGCGGHGHSHDGGHGHSHDGDGGGHGHSHGGGDASADADAHGGGDHGHSHDGGHGHSHDGGGECGGHGHARGDAEPAGGSHGHSHDVHHPDGGGAGCGGHGHSHDAAPSAASAAAVAEVGHGHSHEGGVCSGHGPGPDDDASPTDESAKFERVMGYARAAFGTLAGAQVAQHAAIGEHMQSQRLRRTGGGSAGLPPQAGGQIQEAEDVGELNVRAAFVHVIGDFVQSIGVLIAGVIVWIWPSAKVADPICTLVFAVLVLYTTVPVMRDAVGVLLETVPSKLNHTMLTSSIMAVDGVADVTDLHVWSLTQGVVMLVAHIRIASHVNTIEAAYDVVNSVRDRLSLRHRIHHATIELDDARLVAKMPCIFGFGY